MSGVNAQLLWEDAVWGTHSKQASWLVQRIMKAYKYIQAPDYSINDFMDKAKYSMKEMYRRMRGELEVVTWIKLMWSNFGAPKYFFIMYLAVNRRLATKIRLAKWGLVESMTYPLCQDVDEDIEHLLYIGLLMLCGQSYYSGKEFKGDT